MPLLATWHLLFAVLLRRLTFPPRSDPSTLFRKQLFRASSTRPLLPQLCRCSTFSTTTKILTLPRTFLSFSEATWASRPFRTPECFEPFMILPDELRFRTLFLSLLRTWLTKTFRLTAFWTGRWTTTTRQGPWGRASLPSSFETWSRGTELTWLTSTKVPDPSGMPRNSKPRARW